LLRSNLKSRRSASTSKRSKAGVALMLVITALFLLSVVTKELVISSRIDVKISKNYVNRLQAYYLAQSSARFALLRIHLYKELENMVRSSSSVGKLISQAVPDEMRSQIWSAPLPTFPLSGQESPLSAMGGKMSSLIQSEGSQIPINLLDGNKNRGSNPVIVKTIVKQINEIWESLLEDEDFEDKYGDVDFEEELLNPLIDWIDADDVTMDGGSEDADYENRDSSYKPRNDRMPTLEELHMVKGWSDDIVSRFKKHFSVINSSTEINPNYIDLERFKIFHPDLTASDLQVIAARRAEKAFSSLEEVKSFIQTSDDISEGRDFEFPKGYEFLKSEKNFFIESVGIVGQARRKVKIKLRLDPEYQFIQDIWSEGEFAGSAEDDPDKNDDDGDKVDDDFDRCPLQHHTLNGKKDVKKDSENEGCPDPTTVPEGKLMEPLIVSIQESSL